MFRDKVTLGSRPSKIRVPQWSIFSSRNVFFLAKTVSRYYNTGSLFYIGA